LTVPSTTKTWTKRLATRASPRMRQTTEEPYFEIVINVAVHLEHVI